jgi:hypothetical protein
MTARTRPAVVSTLIPLAVLLIVFSVEIPVFQSIAKAASINSEDFAVLLLSLAALVSIIRTNESQLPLSLPLVTAMFAIVGAWIVLTLIIATTRSEVSTIASWLWALKWFEVLTLLLVAQLLINRERAHQIRQTLLLAGGGVSFVALISTASYRSEVFFNNPNTLASFLVLIILLAGAHMLVVNNHLWAYAAIGFAAASALLTTGSRSGFVALFVGIIMTVLLFKEYISWWHIVSVTSTGVVGAIVTPLFLKPDLFIRLFGFVDFQDGQITLSSREMASTGSINTRIELIYKGIDLFVAQPVFGYGWLAAPTRVGVLDNYYLALLVDIGVVGAILVGVLTLVIFRVFFRAKSSAPILGGVGVAWWTALHVQALTGPFPRAPQLLFLTVLLLCATVAEANETGDAY